METKLMEYFTHFDFTDLIGFAKMVEVDKEIIRNVIVGTAANSAGKDKAIEDLVCSTVEKFSLKTRKERRELLKLAKQIKKENQEIIREKEKSSTQKQEVM